MPEMGRKGTSGGSAFRPQLRYFENKLGDRGLKRSDRLFLPLSVSWEDLGRRANEALTSLLAMPSLDCRNGDLAVRSATSPHVLIDMPGPR